MVIDDIYKVGLIVVFYFCTLTEPEHCGSEKAWFKVK